NLIGRIAEQRAMFEPRPVEEIDARGDDQAEQESQPYSAPRRRCEADALALEPPYVEEGKRELHELAGAEREHDHRIGPARVVDQLDEVEPGHDGRKDQSEGKGQVIAFHSVFTGESP